MDDRAAVVVANRGESAGAETSTLIRASVGLRERAGERDLCDDGGDRARAGTRCGRALFGAASASASDESRAEGGAKTTELEEASRRRRRRVSAVSKSGEKAREVTRRARGER